MSDLIARARAWAAADPDPTTRAEIEALIESDPKELAERFAGPLQFGTAGLRGAIGGGESRMNRAVVRRATAGLARWLLDLHPDTVGRGVVVGHDARRMSREFALDACSVLAAHGIKSALFPHVGPTPLCAFAVLDLGAAAGIMVTASHNPAPDNGYKVYAGDGGQIVPPVDTEIAERIAAGPPADQVPWLDPAEARRSGLLSDLGLDTTRRYLDAVKALSLDPRGRDAIRIVYTPVHGVGDELARRALAEAGFTYVWSVPEQQRPDGAFPTAPFPNPEEKGVLDLALALAREKHANLVLANDPDADRLAVAIPTRDGRWRQLTGNETGVLLGEYLLRHGAGPDRIVMNSIVSSPALGGIAKALGVRFAEVLTGFKWIAHTARALEKQGAVFVFGYEEALGYSIGTVVRDKDGISAVAMFAELAAVALLDGRTIEDELERIARTYGLWASGGRSIVRPGQQGQAEIKATMARVREARPTEIGGRKVLSIRDLGRSVQIVAGVESPLDFPKSDVLVFDLEGDARVIARPSGTEPKIKLYVDVRATIAPDEAFEAARQRAAAEVARLDAAFAALA